ncbi:MAG: hypothetical protein GF388_04000 [Candidatus Aegiribacteria sp.]|nr:hypothetical protein [Candidatus Aegiribacteria sp.]
MDGTTGRIDLYYFGDIGKWDDNNPYFWYRKPYSPEILFQIASSKPYERGIEDIAASIGRKPQDIQEQVSAMTDLSMLSEKQRKYSTSFSIMLERDIPMVRELAESVSRSLAQVILDHQEEFRTLAAGIDSSKEFGTCRILYHTIGCDTLDGAALDALADMGIMATSKEQPGGRNYILQGFQESEALEKLSGNLLCSCNRTGTEELHFVSFGDSDGARKDLFRFLRLKDQLGPAEACRRLSLEQNPITEMPEERILHSCAGVILKALRPEASTGMLSSEERHAAAFLQELEYISVDGKGAIIPVVPLFKPHDRKKIDGIANRVLELILPLLEVEFAILADKLPGLSSIDHGVDEKEIANELWHQVFGRMNEQLVNEGLFKQPRRIEGEGRFFRALYFR